MSTMSTTDTPEPAAEPGACAIELSMGDLVSQVYEAAPSADRGHLLQQLLRPLGLLSAAAIAGGVFAKFRLHAGWQDLNVRADEIQHISGTQVAALVDHAQQVSAEAFDGLAAVLLDSPALAGTAAAALLLAILMKRATTGAGSQAQSQRE